MQKGLVSVVVLVGLLIIAALVSGGYYLLKLKTPEPKACTMEAKLCPDGSSVGRSGPNCEFAPCPSVKPSPSPSPVDETTANWKTYINTEFGYSLRYPVKQLPYFSEDKVTSFVYFSSIERTSVLDPKYWGIGIQFVGTDSKISDITSYVEKWLNTVPKDIQFNWKRETIAVGGEKAEKIYGVRHADAGPSVIEVYVLHDGKIYMIDLYPENKDQFDIFNQILSTFKFLDKQRGIPLGPESEEFFDQLQGRMQKMGTPSAPMEELKQ